MNKQELRLLKNYVVKRYKQVNMDYQTFNLSIDDTLTYSNQIKVLREPFNPLLNKWKEFLVNLCKEKGQEIDKIWFNESVPFDVEIGLRLKGHNCYYECLSFRFEKGKLQAYDSNFGGGTSMLYNGNEEQTIKNENEEQTIKGIMERVFNKECCSCLPDSLNFVENKQKEIEIDEMGWII